MNMAEIIEVTMFKSLENIEKQLKFNFAAFKWEIEHTEDLRTVDGNRVKIYFGVTSPYGGVTIMSFINHGGGYVPYYIKLTAVSEYETKVTVVITGSEDVICEWGERKTNISKQLVEMCEKDCTKKSFKEKAKDFFR